MTLKDLESGKKLTKVPYEADFKQYLSRLDHAEIDAIRTTLAAMIEGREIATAGWIPGGDWTGTAFQPIYEKATRRSQTQAAMCFGLFVWEAVMNHSEDWTSGRFYKDGEEIGSRTYFRI
jgi:hypothetical protein